MTIKVGDRIPSVTFQWMGSESPIDVRSSTSDEIFKGKTVAVFGLPGAYTPVCSEEHLPGFVNHAEELKAKGVDLMINKPFKVEQVLRLVQEGMAIKDTQHTKG